jgi:DNA-binding protein YbaB
MFDKIMEAQAKAGEVKQRLDAITLTGTAEGGKITVNANGNKVIQSISMTTFLRMPIKKNWKNYC